MIKGKLTFLGRVRGDDHKPLRTDTVDGQAINTPAVGTYFVLFAEPLDTEMKERTVRTSVITAVDGDTFTTKNSTYRWEPEEN